MRLRSPLAVALVLAATPLAFAGDTPKGMWDGCAKDSWVQTKTTTKMQMPGVEMPDNTSETRQTLVKVTDDEWTVKTETKSGDAWVNANEFTIPRKVSKAVADAMKDAPKPEDLGTEKVTVDGKEYACKKSKTVFNGVTATSWVSEEHGLLKSVSEAAGGSTSESTVTSLEKKAKIGDKEVVCRETKTVSKAMGSETTVVILMSDAVPMHTVRMESAMAAPMKSSTVMEVVAFEIK